MTNRSLFCAVLFGCLGLCPLAGLAASPAAEPPTVEHRLPPLGPGDSVTIQVYGQPDMGSTEYVSDNGTLSVPLVGAVKVEGLSPVEAATRIEKALKSGQYLVDPHVTVTVTQSRSQRVSVRGQVKNPGRYPLDPGGSVLDVIAQAGGLGETAADVGYIIHTDPAGKVTRQPFSARVAAGSRGETIAEPSLQSGDSIEVPAADQFYVYGEVTTPGKYRIEPNMTVIQAISRAGGVTPRGSERRVDIKRMGDHGSYVTFHARLSDPIKPDDVIHVKESIF